MNAYSAFFYILVDECMDFGDFVAVLSLFGYYNFWQSKRFFSAWKQVPAGMGRQGKDGRHRKELASGCLLPMGIHVHALQLQ